MTAPRRTAPVPTTCTSMMLDPSAHSGDGYLNLCPNQVNRKITHWMFLLIFLYEKTAPGGRDGNSSGSDSNPVDFPRAGAGGSCHTDLEAAGGLATGFQDSNTAGCRVASVGNNNRRCVCEAGQCNRCPGNSRYARLPILDFERKPRRGQCACGQVTGVVRTDFRPGCCC